MQQKMEEFHEASEEEQQKLLEELKRSNELRDQQRG